MTKLPPILFLTLLACSTNQEPEPEPPVQTEPFYSIMYIKDINAGYFLYSMDTTGDGQHSFLEGSAAYYYSFSISHGRNKMAFVRIENSENVLYTSWLDGSHIQKIASSSKQITLPKWSLDDESIFFLEGDLTQSNLVWRGLKNHIKINLTDVAPTTFSFEIFDEDEVMVIKKTDAGKKRIFKFNLITKGLTPVSNEDLSIEEFALSPDKTKVAVSKEDISGPQIFVMSMDGQNLKQISSGASCGETGFSCLGNTNPLWSPDGNYIVYDSRATTFDEIMVYSVQDESVQQITNNTIRDIDPAWSFDSKTIYFSSRVDGIWQIQAINRDGSNLRSLNAQGLFPQIY